ncbi:MAG: helix-turn-helix domain-containing protein, partial [Haloferacaceae archaeon]
FTILSAFPAEDGGVGLVELTADDPDAVLVDIRGYESITELDLLQRHEETALVQFETTMPLLLLPIQGSGIPLQMPFSIQDGRAEWELTTPHRRLSELGDQLRQFGISYTIEEITQQLEVEQLLTDRQSRIVQQAVEPGYYDTPRECTLTELADELGIAKSTCSEILHRAEGKIVKRFTDGLPDRTLAREAASRS